jgi:hypothetical protein
MDVLHDLRHVVLKQYDDYEGIYIARAKMKSSLDSDFQEIPERRRADKMHRLVYQTSLPFIEGDSAITSIQYLETVVSNEIKKKMMYPGQEEISSFQIAMDPERSFARTGILEADLMMYISNRFKEIRWRTSFARAD